MYTLGSHRWTSRLFPPLLLAVVIGSVWYAAAHRNDGASAVTALATTTTTPIHIVPKTTPVAALPLPTVQKQKGKVQFGVDATKVAGVQKVEFYVGNQLMGAAYGTPFTVSVDENSLQTGNHQVVAKVYTDQTTVQTPAADFSTDAANAPSTDPTTPKTTTPIQTTPVATNPAPTSTPPVATTAPDTPANVTGLVENDGTVNISWDAPTNNNGTLNYEVWRDNTKLITTADTSYTDATVQPGQTYSYQIVAVDANSNTSAPSSPYSITTPSSPDAGTQPQNSATPGDKSQPASTPTST